MLPILRVKLETEHVEDRMIIKDAPIKDKNELLRYILENYRNWHFPKVFELEFTKEKLDEEDFNREIEVRETHTSIYKKRLNPIIDQVKNHFVREIKSRFSNFYDLCWSFQDKRGFEVDMDNPFVIQKNNEGNGYALINFVFDSGAILAEFEIEEASEDGKLAFGFLGERDIQENKFFENTHRSVLYMNCGWVRTCKKHINFETFKQGDKVSVLVRNDGYTTFFKNREKIGSTISTSTCSSTKSNRLGIMCNMWKCSIKVSYPEYDDFSKVFENDFIMEKRSEFDALTNYLHNIKRCQTKEFLKELVDFSEKNDMYVWNQQNAYKYDFNRKIIFPEPTIVTAPKDYNQTSIINTIQNIGDGIHFFEVEVNKMNIHQRSFVGVISTEYDYERKKGNYWAYNNYGDIYHNGSRWESSYGEKFKTDGDKIGVFVDLDAGNIEFFLNGISQGVAFTDVKGPVNFYVTIYNNNTTYKILPSNLETYFYYKYADQIVEDLFFKEQCLGVEFENDRKCKVTGGSALMKCKKRFRSGRRYFELDCENLKGLVQFGFDHYNYEVPLKPKLPDVDDLDIDLDVDKIEDFADPIEEKKDEGAVDYSNFTKLGVLVDFDDYKMIIYKDRKQIIEKNIDNIKKPLTGYMMILPEEGDGSTIISINTTAEDEMRDVLFLYE